MITDEQVARIRSLSRWAAHRFYDEVWDQGWEAIAELAKVDRFFLLTWLLNRADADRDWIYQRVREVEAEPDDYLDLWAREHYKSTVITFAGSIQEILKNPDVTIGIISVNRPQAKSFVNQIKREFEENTALKTAFPHVLWQNPKRDAPLWSEDRGIIVKRKSNPKEATVQPIGLIEGLPAGPHYKLRIYDDVITEDTVTSEEIMAKALSRWQQSSNLGAMGGRKWHVGTRYHFNDPYRFMLDEEILKPRIHCATDDGTPGGNPVLLTPEELSEKRRTQGPYIFACQQLLNPVADEAQGFKREWIRFHEGIDPKEAGGMNVYLLVDPANEKKKHSDYTAIFVVGLGADRNYYVLDMIRDRMNLTERANAIFTLHRMWKPLAVGYEKYGKDSDIQHFEDRMRRENYRFFITPVGGNTKKEDRIRRLIPLFEQSRVYLPEVCFKNDYEGRRRDLVRDFIEQEYMGFPVAQHDDMMDCLARTVDPEFPTSFPEAGIPTEMRDRYEVRRNTYKRTWMSA